MSEQPGNPAARELGYCPCCGYLTLTESQPGSYEVCPVCHWMDDPIQFSDVEYVSDTNHVSLERARKNFEEFGAASKGVVEETREPDGEPRDPNWPY
jgi:hypothetical protein